MCCPALQLFEADELNRSKPNEAIQWTILALRAILHPDVQVTLSAECISTLDADFILQQCILTSAGNQVHHAVALVKTIRGQLRVKFLRTR